MFIESILSYNLLKKGLVLPEVGSKDTSWIKIRINFSLRQRIINGNNWALKNSSKMAPFSLKSAQDEATKRKWWDTLSITINLALFGKTVVFNRLK